MLYDFTYKKHKEGIYNVKSQDSGYPWWICVYATENYRTLLKEIKEDLRIWEQSYSWI